MALLTTGTNEAQDLAMYVVVSESHHVHTTHVMRRARAGISPMVPVTRCTLATPCRCVTTATSLPTHACSRDNRGQVLRGASWTALLQDARYCDAGSRRGSPHAARADRPYVVINNTFTGTVDFTLAKLLVKFPGSPLMDGKAKAAIWLQQQLTGAGLSAGTSSSPP